jgi:hypothetical protein
MIYIVTEQFARGEEKAIAEFCELNDAKIFINKKIDTAENQHTKLIYRYYDESGLLQEFNKENISISHAQYAEEDADFINQAPFLFKVTFQTKNSPERKSIANFNENRDANLFIIGKFEFDSTVKDSDYFCIFEDRILMKTLFANQKSESKVSKGSQSMATFHPTPTPTRPIPPGNPKDCWIEKEDEEDK